VSAGLTRLGMLLLLTGMAVVPSLLTLAVQPRAGTGQSTAASMPTTIASPPATPGAAAPPQPAATPPSGDQSAFVVNTGLCEAHLWLRIDPWLQALYLIDPNGVRTDVIPNPAPPPDVGRPYEFAIHESVTVRYSTFHAWVPTNRDIFVHFFDSIRSKQYLVQWAGGYAYQPGDRIQLGFEYSYDKVGTNTRTVNRDLPPCGSVPPVTTTVPPVTTTVPPVTTTVPPVTTTVPPVTTTVPPVTTTVPPVTTTVPPVTTTVPPVTTTVPPVTTTVPPVTTTVPPVTTTVPPVTTTVPPTPMFAVYLPPAFLPCEAYDVALVIDRSASMNEEMSDNTESKLNAAIKAATSFVRRFLPSENQPNRIAIVGFKLNAWMEHALTNQRNMAERALECIRMPVRDCVQAEGTPALEEGTNLAHALQVGGDALITSPGSPLDHHVLILLSDGAPTCRAPCDPVGAALDMATRVKAMGIRIITIGVGPSVNDDLMRTIANIPSDYYPEVQAPDSLEQAYREIARSLCSGEQVKVHLPMNLNRSGLSNSAIDRMDDGLARPRTRAH